MKTILLKGLNDKQVDEMRQMFAASANIRQHIISVLKEKINTSNKNTRSKDAYNVPNWAYLQADGVGYERALVEVIGLLTSESSQQDPPPAVPTKRKYTRKTQKDIQT